MENPNVNGNGTNNGAPQEGNQPNPETTVTVVRKNGIGTTIKVVAGLVGAAAFTGLGWLLKGIFGGKDVDAETVSAESESPEE